MPIFEYYCVKCKELFEELVFNPENEDIVCPVCREREHVKRCVSATTRTRGSGRVDSNFSPGPGCGPGAFS
ncbi:FmdB family zinc ribbon protein [Desulfonatronovibrio hydrogenovorans]|uniref:FmdB family zinc ribbon protein n=1 Tax=Desulfonatronovibrio hydrogenovorans TaxID=53245 RepID=UPI0005525D56|nr:FmdB family zinc ribbon protein [Desulfonatronovibrio hydrogenovorans]